MKKLKYLPIYIFFGSLIINVLLLRFLGPGGRGNYLPRIGPLTWSEIFSNFHRYVLASLTLSFFIYLLIKASKKMSEGDEAMKLKRTEDIEKYHSPANAHECRVCGCSSEEFPWGEDGKSPTYEICPCCGVQFGKEDVTLESIQKYRAEWLRKRAKWFAKNSKPEHWVLEEQMKHIPEGFK